MIVRLPDAAQETYSRCASVEAKQGLKKYQKAVESAREKLEIDNQLLAKNDLTKAELGFR